MSVNAGTPRRRLVGTSTKMYFDYARTISYAKSVTQLTNAHHKFPLVDVRGMQLLDIFVIPDFVSVIAVNEALQHSTSDIWVGAQDVHDEESGPFTGEVSAKTLAQAGCRLVEIGHAERRRLFGETDAWVTRKATTISRHGMIPLICVGEKVQSSVEQAAETCFHQVEGVLAALSDAEIVIAYEPVWAIGAAEPAGAEAVPGNIGTC
ncbi:triose-phosphate isomerase [Malassezia cuniculi]|uniref:Triosephosphate isomerase n=1 Tax=Malassezia cuniculi TaxID=948313 RepID=A0AAF0J5G0_9BASI|nr:triose-phosphate isomerase [Malassezia cuniculi]